MTTVENILKEIDQLPTQDLNILAYEILKKINVMEKITNILSEYQGIGEGIWVMNAQDYVNFLRTDDRL